MQKIPLIGLAIFSSYLTGCAVQSHDPQKPAMFADKGSYFKQDTSKSLASNLVAFSGYPYLISDHDIPSDLKASLNFTSGAYLGFNGFSSLFGAGGVGLLSIVSDNTLPYQSGLTLIMVPMNQGEKYDDYSVAERGIKASFEKINPSLLSKSQQNNPDIQKFLTNKNMDDLKCYKAPIYTLTDVQAYCDYGDSNFGLTVIFSRPATGQEFPELGLLPKGQYSVMLIDDVRYPVHQLRADAWAAIYSSSGFMQFKNIKLPFLSPDNSNKRIAFVTEKGKENVIYK